MLYRVEKIYKKLKRINFFIQFRKNKNHFIHRRLIVSSWIYALLSIIHSSSSALSNNNEINKSDKQNKKINRKNLYVTVKDFGAIGDGVKDDTNFLKSAIQFAEQNLGTYVCIPNFDENYLINSELCFTEPGIKIFGFKGSTYNRGAKKNGNIILGEQADCAFNLGNFRIWNRTDINSNPADSWTITNIGVVQKSDLQPRIKNGFMFSSKTDGPDRGVVIRECSTTGLNSSVYIPNPDVPISLSTLIIENCCFSNNNYSVYSEGRVCGVRIVGNQMEQNTLGAIHGTFDGPVYIADNMLEGQPNTINIVSPKNGNRLGVIIERNYFELNTGEYLIRIEMASNTGVLIVKDNYDLNLKTKDFLVLTGGGAANITLGKNLFEPRCVTFDQCVGTVKYGSRILDDISYYKVRRFLTNMGNRSALVLISDYTNFIGSNNHNNIICDGKEIYISALGQIKCVSGASPISLDISVQQFDVLGISIFCFVLQKDNCTLQLFDIDNEIYMDGSNCEIDICGKWCLMNFAFYAQKNTKNLLLRLTYSKYIKIAGVAVKNYGKHVNDGTMTKEIYPVMPNFF